jgi:hypothetical protein
MAIQFSCACGKKLRVQDEFEGKRVRCLACGKVLTVPTQEQERPAAREPARPRAAANDRVGVDEEPDASRALPRAKRKKRKKTKERSFSGWGGVDILGFHLTLRSGIAALCVLALLGGLIWVFVPSYHPKVVEVQRVDAYAALDVGKPNMQKRLLGLETGDVLKLGSEKFLVIRDSPEGEAVVIKLELPPKFLEARTRATQGTLMIQTQDFLLQGDGEPLRGLILDLEREFKDPTKGAALDFSNAVNGDPVLPRDRPPWNPQGKTTKEYQDQAVANKDDPKDAGFVCFGKAEFRGKNGMEVNYDYQGNSLVLTWDAKSRGYVGNDYQDFVDRFMLESLKVSCVFPRPSGKQWTLTVFGEKVPIKPK